jgi:hypothetical protein
MSDDKVDHPPHYTKHPSGVECIQITEHFGFCIGNAIKYLWRADLKGNAVEDLEKARWYIDREIQRRQAKPTVTDGLVVEQPLASHQKLVRERDEAIATLLDLGRREEVKRILDGRGPP